ncbi:response regulator [Sphingomonas sp. LaA6.9]|uniref:response regulator n=1 Tax=Sphingomonas sp. LaA6.9 TaxID=2919914 RepID=UPI001F503CAD|nr:response regulator [Sphingomonas sp. LaA6.9]MCJ8159082.1 response regulator [Sphingomonas sp. LaA6.9]
MNVTLNADEQEPGQLSILVVDDDPSLRSLVRDFLVAQGYAVHEAEDGPSMRRVMAQSEVHIVILDVMMPGEDGLSIARSLAQQGDVGVIMVSALGSETDRIIGLEVGADDYLPKPISPRELLARIRALQRRRRPSSGAQSGTAQFCFEGWRLDPIRRVLRDPGGVIISLSEGEFGLLLTLVERPQRVLSRDQLLELSRGQDSEAFDRAIDTQVSRLRRKLATRMRGEIIRTIRSEGYMFLPPVTRG